MRVVSRIVLVRLVFWVALVALASLYFSGLALSKEKEDSDDAAATAA